MNDRRADARRNLDEKLAVLRTRFISNAVERVDELRAALDVLRYDAGNATAIERLFRHFHGIAGAGATYGLPDLSALGRAGEEACGENRKHGLPLESSVLAACEGVVDAIARALEQASASAVPPTPEPPRPAGHAAFGVTVVSPDGALTARLAAALRPSGIAVETSGAEAASHFENQIVVVDLDRKDATPDQVVGDVRRRCQGALLLAVGASLDLLMRVDALRAGADLCFSTTDDWSGLLDRVRHERTRSMNAPSRILSVEDDEDQARFISTVLESAGYEVRVCASAAEVDVQLHAYQPDLIVMDVNLGGVVTGHHLARSIRQQTRYTALPIIFLTARAEAQSITDSMLSGGDDHLVKPVTPNSLLTTVAARLERARMLRYLLDHDSLTGLLTHTAFYDRASAVFVQARRRNVSAVVAMLDVDHFKRVNDSFGHVAGDNVLASLAALLRNRLRPVDVAGRYGGEEFGVVLPDVGFDEARRMIEAIRQEWAAQSHETGSGETISVTFSGGLSPMQDGLRDVTAWIEMADRELYEAKRSGRNRVEPVAWPPPG